MDLINKKLGRLTLDDYEMTYNTLRLLFNAEQPGDFMVEIAIAAYAVKEIKQQLYGVKERDEK